MNFTKCVTKVTICFVVAGLVAGVVATSSMGAEDKYIQVAKEAAEKIWPDTVLTREQLEDELIWFAKASAPYRGRTITLAYESNPQTDWAAHCPSPP
ncbi:unnamed protein product, partial [marine sediment metagenome]